MTNKDLIKQYVDTGLGIPKYQFDKLSTNLKQTYLRRIEIAIHQAGGDMSITHYYYAKLPSDIQMRMARIDGYSFVEFLDKTFGDAQAYLDRDVELYIIKDRPEAIELFKNPDKEAQMLAVSQHWETIATIENPDKEAQMLAVDRSRGEAIKYDYIENPHPSVLRYYKKEYEYS